MSSQFQVRLIERITAPKEGNALSRTLQNAAAVLVIPLILIGGALLMLALLPISMYQRLFSSKEDRENKVAAPPEHDWTPFIHVGDVALQKKFLGEVRFGPAYLSLSSEPVIPGLAAKVYGDWNHRTANGLLLQQWNSTTNANADLIFLDARDMKLHALLKNIDNVNWSIENLSNGDMLFVHNSGKVKEKYWISELTQGASASRVQ